MVKELIEKKEKRVEYVELIYDLIFVFIIGRNNSLLHDIEGGFVKPGAFSAYLICTLAVIQIWTLTTYYINMYGRKSVRDHVFMFINMFLMYFLAEGTRGDWASHHTSYHIAWALILLNSAAQYIIELRNHRGEPSHKRRAITMAGILIAEALAALAAIPEYNIFSTSYLSWLAVTFSMLAILLSGIGKNTDIVDFEHLTERVMLYVVFTFGEMIIAISTYFDDGFDIRNLYFAVMAFLIVVGLFVSYGVVYDRIVDRSRSTGGLGYMLIHIFLIFALSGITAGLEFMREDEIALEPKMIFLISSFILYYIFLFLTGIYAKKRCGLNARFYLIMAGLCAAFAGLMVLFMDNPDINIAVSVAFVFSVFGVLRLTAAKMEKAG